MERTENLKPNLPNKMTLTRNYELNFRKMTANEKQPSQATLHNPNRT